MGETKINYFLNVGLLLPAPLITYSLLKSVISCNDCKGYLKGHVPEDWTMESQIRLLITVYALFSLYFLCVVMVIAGSRFFIAPNPLVNQDPKFTAFFNRVLTNSIEQAAIFLPLLSYWTINLSNNDNKHQVLIFGLLWLLGRILFICGYSLALLSDKLFVCRSTGFFLTLACSFTMVFRIFGYNLF